MFGLWDSQAPERKVGRAFIGRLMSGPYPIGVSGQRVDPAFLGRLVYRPLPFEVLESGRLAMGVGPRPKVPTNMIQNRSHMYSSHHRIIYYIKFKPIYYRCGI